MFRGKESLNRIELSWLVLELLNFGVSGSLRLWGVGGGWIWVGGGWGCPTHMCTCMCMHARKRTCMRTHARTHTCMHGKHDNFMQMAAPIGFGEILGIPYDVMCACMRVHVHVCRGHPLTNPHPHPPTTHPPEGRTPRISQNSITLELIEIFQFRLKIWNLWRLPHHGWVYGLVGGWVGWWVGSGQNTKNLKIVNWIKIIQFCLKIYDL